MDRIKGTETNNGNSTSPLLGGNYPIVFLYITYWWLHIYINCFTWMIFFHDHIYYTKNWMKQEFSKFSQCNGKSPLPRWKQGNYLVIIVYGTTTMPNNSTTTQMSRMPVRRHKKTPVEDQMTQELSQYPTDHVPRQLCIRGPTRVIHSKFFPKSSADQPIGATTQQQYPFFTTVISVMSFYKKGLPLTRRFNPSKPLRHAEIIFG